MHVIELWRYPVKSMQGERLDAALIDERGVTGDRQWALVDNDTGLALTARRVPALLFAAATWSDDDVEITLPDGTATTDDQALSEWLQRSVTLRRAGPAIHGRYEIALDFEHEDSSQWVQWDGPSGRFHDSRSASVSVLSTASMAPWDHRRFRANVVVEADEVGAEDGLVDQRVEVGDAQLTVVKQIDRCVMTTRPQPGGIERDLDVLRTINAERGSFLGVGALVTKPGLVSVGDEVRVVT